MNGAISTFLWRLGCASSALALTPTSALAGTQAGDAQIAVVTPLSFIQVENLDFGRVIASDTAGTVTISATGLRNNTGGALPVGPSFQFAKFAGRGTQNQIVIVRIQQTTINITGPGPAMRVRTFTIGPEGSLAPIIAPLYRILTPSGIFWFNVGATLEVGANQPSGAYSGTFTAELQYL